jgi:hypothetical protein
MDWSYANILINLRHKVRLFWEHKTLHHVDDLQKLDNEPLYPQVVDPELGTYVVMDDQEKLVTLSSDRLNGGLWTMQFYGTWSIFGAGAGVVLLTHASMVLLYSFHLETWKSMNLCF